MIDEKTRRHVNVRIGYRPLFSFGTTGEFVVAMEDWLLKQYVKLEWMYDGKMFHLTTTYEQSDSTIAPRFMARERVDALCFAVDSYDPGESEMS